MNPEFTIKPIVVILILAWIMYIIGKEFIGEDLTW